MRRKPTTAAGAIDPTGLRKAALEAFLTAKVQQGFEVEADRGTHAIIVGYGGRGAIFPGIRRRKRFVVSVDEHGGEVTMIPAEPRRS